MQLMPGVGPTSAQRALDFMAEAADLISALANAPVPSSVARQAQNQRG